MDCDVVLDHFRAIEAAIAVARYKLCNGDSTGVRTNLAIVRDSIDMIEKELKA